LTDASKDLPQGHTFPGNRKIFTIASSYSVAPFLQLFSAGDDASVRVWDLVTKTCAATLRKHFSAVTGLAVSADGWTLLSVGRDKVANAWNLRDNSLITTVPVYEALEVRLRSLYGKLVWETRYKACLSRLQGTCSSFIARTSAKSSRRSTVAIAPFIGFSKISPLEVAAPLEMRVADCCFKIRLQRCGDCKGFWKPVVGPQ
jgi:WD40 repeat protein